jgi:hypothetical protein
MSKIPSLLFHQDEHTVSDRARIYLSHRVSHSLLDIHSSRSLMISPIGVWLRSGIRCRMRLSISVSSQVLYSVRIVLQFRRSDSYSLLYLISPRLGPVVCSHSLRAIRPSYLSVEMEHFSSPQESQRIQICRVVSDSL